MLGKQYLLLLALASTIKAIDWHNAEDGSWAMGCDFYGNDLNNVKSSGEQCGGICTSTMGCTHFTWNNHNGGTCWMKTGPILQQKAVPKDNSFVCGTVNKQGSNQVNNPSSNQPNHQPSSFSQPDTNSVEFKTINNCPFTIWIGMQGRSKSNPNWRVPEDGGWELKSGQSFSVKVPKDYYAGRIWGRTNCNYKSGQFRCETGDCGPWIKCANGGVQRGGQTPATLAEFTLNGSGDQDFYDVSLVDGYNLKMAVEVTNPSSSNGEYWCKNPSCIQDLNQICPSELRKYSSAGQVIGCLSACEKFQTDSYCCRGAHGTPETCKSYQWPVNYPSIYKNACPAAYSYAYDDSTSTFFCRNTNYNIKFC